MSRTYRQHVEKTKSHHYNATPYQRTKQKSYDYDNENYNAVRHSY